VADAPALISHVYLTLRGTDAPEALMQSLVEVTVESSLHLPDVATVVLNDPGLQWIDHELLAPGTALVISTTSRNGTSAQPIFDGEIVELEPDFQPATQLLAVRAFNRLHRLTHGRYVRSFLNVSDADLVQKIASEVGLQAQVDSTPQVHDYVLQHNQTNLEFLRSRMSALGHLLFVRGRTLHSAPPTPEGTPVELEWGVSLSEFRPRLTALGRADGVTVRGWDPANKREIVGQAGDGRGTPEVGAERNGGALVKSAFNLSSPVLITDRPVRTQAAADQLAQAVADQIAGSYIEADGVGPGDPGITAGALVRMSAVGERFGGTYYVTSATHSHRASEGYSVQFAITGHRPGTLLGLLAPTAQRDTVIGLVVGIVTDNQDPEGLGRVKVKYPFLSSDHASTWARLVAPGAGAERGWEWVPEVNDEVLIGFEHGDVHYPYVIGGLWNGTDAPPQSSTQLVQSGKVQKRVVRSRTGHTIVLDDSDGGGGILIEDSQGNKIQLDTQANSLTIEVQGDATIKAAGNMTFDATGKVAIKGMGISVDAGGANVDVKGTTINLN
jgi:phage protein D/phage baseplate assembly protein gpV